MSPAPARSLPVARALAGLAVFACGGVGQWLLEQSYGAPHVSPRGPLLLLVSALLALPVLAGGEVRFAGARPLALAIPARRWLLACVPPLLLLVAAAALRFSISSGALLALWLSGVGGLFAVGAAQAWRTREDRRADAAVEWPWLWILLSYAALLALALWFRCGFDLEHLPAFIENDEAFTGVAARALREQPFDWFGLWEVGIPNFVLVFVRAAELLFGDNLWGIRMGGAMMGSISVLATFAAARRLIGNGPALLAALLLVAAHTHLHWSRNGHMYIQTPAAAAVIVWQLTRMWTGGSLLAWVGAGVALGVGTQTYQASFAFPLIVFATLVGWSYLGRVGWKKAVLAIGAVEIVAALLLAPVVRLMLAQAERVEGRPARISIFDAENFHLLGNEYALKDPEQIVVEHVRRTLSIFNFSVDGYVNYGANRSLVDAVTAALVPAAAAMVLLRLGSPLGWLCATWIGAYFWIGCLMWAHAPAYHRIPSALLFVSMAVAWCVVQLCFRITAGLRLPKQVAVALCAGFGGLAAAANAHYYFSVFPAVKPPKHAAVLALLMCRYGATHTILDATALDGVESIPIHNVARTLQCPDAHRIAVPTKAALWKIRDMTDAKEVVLIVPAKVDEASHPNPEGYRIVRQFVDHTIVDPEPIPLAVFEMERLDAAGAAG